MTMAGMPEGLAQADGMTGVIIFAVVYAIVSVLAKIKQASQKGGTQAPPEQQQRPRQQPRRPQPRLEQASDRQQRTPKPPVTIQQPGGTQAEATRLEELLRALGDAAGVPVPEGTVGRPARVPLPSDEEVEERESLEIEEQVLNLETEVKRESRREVDHDDEAEGIIQRRRIAAQDRDRSLSRADHQAFDKKIRQIEPDNTRVAKVQRPSLRQAIVWREILGPPLALRDRSDFDL